MASHESTEVYDLLLLVDATSSMTNYLQSLRISLPKVLSLSNLTDSFERIGLLAYRDYTEVHAVENPILEWSGWYQHGAAESSGNTTAHELVAKAASIQAYGGGDFPEATKTGLARAYSLMREDATTIILLYTDAPPHCWTVADKERRGNYYAEQAALKKADSYEGSGLYFTDWVAGCKQLHNGPRKAHVFCFLDEILGSNTLHFGYYLYLSTITRGACLYLNDTAPHNIARVTVDVLLAWMGTEKASAGKEILPATLVRYKSGKGIRKIVDEKDPIANAYFWSQDPSEKASTTMGNKQYLVSKVKQEMEENRAKAPVNPDVLRKYLPKKKTPVADFARRYVTDEGYRKIVVHELQNIIETDVTSISLNPVFGSLWRTVCNDRTLHVRNELLAAFSLSVDRIHNADEKTRMKNWLEESYDFSAEILDTIEAVRAEQRFPCVYLDPTIEFLPAKTKGDKAEEDDDRRITAFRRDELLEIGRSCDRRILRRLGKILTQLTYIESADELPTHIAATSNAEVPRIPVSLASKEYEWQFWRILLHTVLPGTMLATRPAMVLAALAIRIGLKPLFPTAASALLFWRDKWNDPEVPETWSVGCLGLLLDADAEYRKQGDHNGSAVSGDSELLLPSDRELFTNLVAYKLAEANLLTTLEAKISWTPSKTQSSIGHVEKCTQCKHPRSITIMVPNSGGKCGLCVVSEWKDEAQKQRNIQANITDSGNASWVECSVSTCRAQYVCYNPTKLNVRPKCHYCRSQSSLPAQKRSWDPAPTLECGQCLSKIIWPHEWRTSAPNPFICFACNSGRKTVVSVDTNAAQLSKENGQTWLLENKNDTLKQPFKGSLFRTISTVGQKAFMENVRILPTYDSEQILTLRGKPIQNQTALKDSLLSWIRRRAIGKTPCSLCFSELPNARLLPACRRHGCNQLICESCLNGWYGLNSVGHIINIAALFCPFCRRPPSSRTLAAYGKGIHAVGDLMAALKEKGKWIHAWCRRCGRARRYMERQCAQDAPPGVERWMCEECNDAVMEEARIAEEEARQALMLAAQLELAEQRQQRSEAERALELARRRRRELEYPVKKCPGCGTLSQKTTGCDHVTCPVPRCGTHWCWNCTLIFSPEKIYAHMQKTHGGWDAGAWGHGGYNAEGDVGLPEED